MKFFFLPSGPDQGLHSLLFYPKSFDKLPDSASSLSIFFRVIAVNYSSKFPVFSLIFPDFSYFPYNSMNSKDEYFS